MPTHIMHIHFMSGSAWIPLTGFTPPHGYTCPKQWHGFSLSNWFFVCVFNGLRREVIIFSFCLHWLTSLALFKLSSDNAMRLFHYYTCSGQVGICWGWYTSCMTRHVLIFFQWFSCSTWEWCLKQNGFLITVKSAHVVTSIKQSPVLKSHIFFILS